MSLFNNNFTKPGKGVSKEDVERERRYPLLNIIVRKKGILLKLNLLYFIFCLPFILTVVTYLYTGISIWTGLCALSTIITGVATAGFATVLRSLVKDEPVFFLSEFFEGMRKNWKQAITVYLIFAIAIGSLSLAAYTYSNIEMSGFFRVIILGIVYLFIVIAVFMLYYVYTMMITFNLRVFEIIRNAAIFVVLGLWRNIFATFFIVLNYFIIEYLPIYPIPHIYILVFGISLTGLIVMYLTYPVIKMYMLDPIEAAKKSEDNSVFNDEITDDQESN